MRVRISMKGAPYAATCHLLVPLMADLKEARDDTYKASGTLLREQVVSSVVVFYRTISLDIVARCFLHSFVLVFYHWYLVPP